MAASAASGRRRSGAGSDAHAYSKRIFPTVEGVRNTVRILSRIDAKFSKLKAEDLVDERIVRKLERDGVLK